MVIHRGDVWWASLPVPRRSEPGYRRPVMVVQSVEFNRSLIHTVVVVPMTSNTGLADAPGNVLVPRHESRLPRDAVANVSQPLTLDRSLLRKWIGSISGELLARLDAGLRIVLALQVAFRGTSSVAVAVAVAYHVGVDDHVNANDHVDAGGQRIR